MQHWIFISRTRSFDECQNIEQIYDFFFFSWTKRLETNWFSSSRNECKYLTNDRENFVQIFYLCTWKMVSKFKFVPEYTYFIISFLNHVYPLRAGAICVCVCECARHETNKFKIEATLVECVAQLPYSIRLIRTSAFMDGVSHRFCSV